MAIDGKTFFLDFGERQFEVKAGIHAERNLKRFLPDIKPRVDFLRKDFDWAEHDNLVGLMAGLLYRPLRKQLRTNDVQDIFEEVEDILSEATLSDNQEEVTRKYELLGGLIMDVYFMGIFGMNVEEFIKHLESKTEEVRKELEKEKEALKRLPPQKKSSSKKKSAKPASAGKTQTGRSTKKPRSKSASASKK